MSASAQSPSPVADAPKASDTTSTKSLPPPSRMTSAEYLQSPHFSKDHPGRRSRLFVGFLFLAGCAIYALPHTAPKFTGIASVTEAVTLAAAWGAVPIFCLSLLALRYSRLALAELGVNRAIAHHVEASAHARLEAIRQDPRLRGSVSKLESEHLPDNPSNPKPASLRLFKRICADAMDRRFEPTVNLIEPYQRESMEPVLKLEGVQRNSLRWGILCHFIGLVIVIQALPEMIGRAEPRAESAPATIASANSPAQDNGSGRRERVIYQVLDGLRLAFGASVAGLSVSLFGAMLLGEVRKKQFLYFRQLDEATSTLVSLASNSLNNDELLQTLSQVSSRLEHQTTAVKEGIGIVAGAMAQQTKQIEVGLKSLGDGKIKLDSFLQGISSGHDDFLKRLNAYYDVGTISSLVGGTEKRITETVGKTQADLSARLSRHERAIAELKGELGAVRTGISGIEATTSAHLGGSLFRVLPYLVAAMAGAVVLNMILLWSRS